MKKKSISNIVRIGAVVITTLTSLAISPPIIDPVKNNNGVNWQNIFVFVTGVLTIIFFDKYKKKKNFIPNPFLLTGIFISLLIVYEFLYNKYSITCDVADSQNLNTYRCVISKAAVRSDVKPDLDGWISNKAPEPIKTLLTAYDCTPTKIWKYNDLIVPYYSFIFLYFLLIIIFILLLISISDKALNYEL